MGKTEIKNNKQLESRLNNIRKNVGDVVVIKIGVPDEGHFDILDIERIFTSRGAPKQEDNDKKSNKKPQSYMG